jgi:anti-anti-sigma regulatory factor
MTTVLHDVGSSQDSLRRLIAQAHQQVESRVDAEIRIDFSSVSILQSETIGQLVRLHLKAQRYDSQLVLENVDPCVLEVLVLTRLDRMLRIRMDSSRRC